MLTVGVFGDNVQFSFRNTTVGASGIFWALSGDSGSALKSSSPVSWRKSF